MVRGGSILAPVVRARDVRRDRWMDTTFFT